MKTDQWVTSTDQRWMDALDAMKHDVYHLPSYLEIACEDRGDEPGAYIFEDSDGLFLLPLILRPIPGTSKRDATSPYGYPGPLFQVTSGVDHGLFLSRALSSMLRLFEARSIVSVFLRMHPLFPMPSEPFLTLGALVLHGPTISIDLRKDDDAMWSDVRQNHRRGINKARRAGAIFEHDEEWANFDDFVELYESTMHRQNANDQYLFPRRYFEEIRYRLGDSFRLLTVTINGQVISGGLFAECDGLVQYHLSGSHADFLNLQPLKLLLHEAGRWARDRGNEIMHLGGGLGANQDSLYNFKLGFSKVTTEFSSWRSIVNRSAFADLVSAWEDSAGVQAESLDGFFPPYRRPFV